MSTPQEAFELLSRRLDSGKATKAERAAYGVIKLLVCGPKLRDIKCRGECEIYHKVRGAHFKGVCPR